MFRLLSVPCSTGEEPYSMAMALRDGGAAPHRVRIDAVDVSGRFLRHARQGVYGRNSFRGADQLFRERYFEATADGYRVAEDLRGQVHFLQGNLCSPGFLADSDPYDVIFCRNLLIYFDRPTQDRVIGVLTRLLTPDGLLFIGSSESGVMAHHDFMPSRMPMTFAFYRTAPASREPQTPAHAPRRRARRSARPAPPARVHQPLVRAAAAPAGRERSPRQVPPPALRQREGIQLAERLADQGRFAEAAALCEESLRQGPSASAFYLLALVRDASGNLADADACYRKALYLEPTHREALAHLALLMDRQGRQTDAQLLRNRMRRLEPRDDSK
jgi:chemotaxis protein methyltransferase WspC